MHRLVLAAAAFASAGCIGQGYEVVAVRSRLPPADGSVILYRIEAPEDAAASCESVATVRAWSRGEKTFPYTPFREAAAALGGNGVRSIRGDPDNHDRHISMHLGEVVRCQRRG